MENIQDIYPLSPMQEGMLFHSIYSPESVVYKEQFSCKLEGKLEIQAFKYSWMKVIERHDILRTAFVWEDVEEPLQIVHTEVVLPFIYEDLSKKADKEKLAFDYSNRLHKEKLEFSEAPLMKITLLKLSDNEHYLIWDHHHILFDGWGLPVLMQEFMTIYSSKINGQQFELNKTYPYKNYIAWLKNQNEEKTKNFWLKRLEGFIKPTKLNLPLKDLPIDGYKKERTFLSAKLTEKISNVNKIEKLTINTMIQAAWSLLLSYYTNSDDVVFGATVSGRNADVPGIENMVGLFINTLPVRTKIKKSEKIIDWLKNYQIAQSELQDYEHSPLFQIQTWSEVPKGESLFNTIVVLENYPVSEALTESNEILKISNVESVEKTNYPLTFVVSPGKQIGIEIAYDTNEFDQFAIEQIIERFKIILDSIADNLDNTIDDIQYTSDIERKYLESIACGDSNRKYPFKNTARWFQEIAVKNRDKIAVISDDENITFGELDKKSNQIANYLIERNVISESIIGVCLNRSVDMICWLVGINKVGAAVLPIDINYPEDRIKFIIKDSGLTYLVTETSIVEKLNLEKKKVIASDQLLTQLKNYSDRKIVYSLDEQNLSYLVYTSGSTGKPKAVGLLQKGLCNFVNNTIIDFQYGDDEKVLQFSSFGFDAAIGEIYSSLLSSGTLFIPKREVTLSENDLAKYIETNKITFAYLPPSYLSIINPEKFTTRLKIASVGDKCSTQLAEKWGKKLTFFNGYGPTETTIGASYLKFSKSFPNVNSYPIGKGFGNIRIYLLDQNLQLVPIGVTGELHISGDGIARGYLNRADLTAEKFIPDSLSLKKGLRMYRTGDNAKYLPDGNIEFIGRKDFQVKLRGYRIELNEIDFLIKQNEAVKDSIVVDIREENGNEYLAAYIIKDHKELNEEDIFNNLRAKLPEFMLPNSITFLEEFPLTANGKVDREKLPKANSISISNEHVAPNSSTEEIIANIWCDILNLEKVGINSNFFELGGHSLLATQLISRLRETFGKEIPFETVFESKDLESLADQVDKQIQENTLEDCTINRVDRNDKIPLSYSQQRLWFLDQLKPNDPSYNIPTVLKLNGNLNLEYVEEALNQIINKHEILRTSFLTEKGKPYQNIHSVFNITIDNIFADGDNTEDRLDYSREFIRENTLIPFNLHELPLLRCANITINKNENILFFVVHHIIADGWSLSLLVDEFISIYSSLEKNENYQLKELEIQFADYAAWQQQHFLSKKYTKELNYWKEQLVDIPPILELPYDKVKPKLQTTNCDKVDLIIEEHLVEKLNRVTRSENATLFMSLLSVFQFLLSKYSNMNDIIVGTPIAGRNNKQLENLVGFFVNNLAIRTKINKYDTFSDLLNQVRNNTLEAYSNQTLPFDRIVEELQPERDLSHQPIFQVMFVFQNLPSTDINLNELKIQPFETQTLTTNYDITMTLQENGKLIQGSIDFNTDLFEKDTIERFANHYKLLIEKLFANPDQNLSDVQILSHFEKTLILNEWSSGKQIDFTDNVVDRFEAAVTIYPDNTALVYKTNGDSNRDTVLSYKELNIKINKLANYIQSSGIKPEERIAICMKRHEDMIISIFAILKSGCAFLPIDPSLPFSRINYMLETANCSKIILHNDTKEKLEQINNYKLNLDELKEIISKGNDENLNISLDQDRLAYVIFTSGSTGVPKGVMLNHKGLTNLSIVQKEKFHISNNKKVMQFSSLSFDAAVWETVMALLNGASLYLTSKEIISSGYELAEYLEQNDITTITLPPSVLAVLPKKHLPKLETLITAGEPISPQEVIKWSHGRTYFNAYGPTETTVCATMLSPQKDYQKGPPIGKSINNFETYILDSNWLPVGIGIPGELCIGGIGIARGYINKPDLTAEKFIPNPFSNTGNRLYKTGDLTKYLPDGNIEYLGRIDTQIKLRGFRIEISEIEHTLKHIDFVNDAAVVIKKLSDSQEKLVGYIVCGSEEYNKEKIQIYLKDKLPEYMIPSAFVRLEKMPLTISGKVDKSNLPMPEISREELGVDYVAPRSDSEKKLVKIVEELLSVKKVGVKDNFFQLGGHSLLATQFISRIKEDFDREVKLIKIFEDPTIEGVLRNIENSVNDEVSKRPTIKKISRDSRRTKRADL